MTVLMIGTATFAQLSKEEKKEWGKKLKSTSVEDYKSLVDGKEESDAAVADLESEVSALNDENSRLQQELDNLKNQLAEAQTAPAVEAEEPTEESEPEETIASASSGVSGLIFKVQIGAYKEFDIRKYFDNNKNFSGEVDEDGTMRYTIGLFKDYWEADQFKKYLREMGVKGAWVVSYKDGNRIPIKDALEGVH